MDSKNLQALFQNQVNNGATIGNGTTYFQASESLPVSGEDVILASNEGTIKVEPSSRSTNLVVYYLTKGGRWISKNTLFGRHFLETANPMARIQDMQCRTVLKNIPHEIQRITVAGKTVDVYLFTKDTKIVFGKKDSVYGPVQQDAWNPSTRTMNVSRQMTDYATLTVGE